MGIAELFVLAVGLSMDAFAVSICKGLAMDRVTLKKACIPGLWFGGFQGLMPLIGWLLGSRFAVYITSVDHWIAFVLLAVLGGNMIREAVGDDDDDEGADASLGFRTMLAMAVATSIDALAVGITFAFLQVNILWAVCFIAMVTFMFSAAGVKIGNLFGTRFKSKAEIMGGVILILLGVKILLEHLGII